MAEGAVSFLLDKLSILLSKKYTQLEGLERDVQYIMDELESMRDFLRNAEAKQDYGLLDAEQQTWIKQVRDAAYEMEDIVDDFLLNFAHHGGGVTGFRGKTRHIYNSIKNLKARHRISSKIIDIKKEVADIETRHKKWQCPERIIEASTYYQHPIRGHALLLEESDLVGIDEPKREIKELISSHNSHLKAISVLGMGGLGKTTLVKRVFEDADVRNVFFIHAWLTISQTFKIEDAFKELIRQICEEVKQPIPHDVNSMDANRLRAFVKQFLTNKRYIIVLDDLWKLDHWNSIKYVFPNSCGNCILITTRIADIATSCCLEFHGNVYPMKHLSRDESWNLFHRKTFGDNKFPSHLKSIANKILDKCEGLPLGIVVIGGLLALKDTSEWEMVLRSIGSELEGNGKLEPITKILFLSYNELPYYLKSCLLYMGIFPEDEVVDIEQLLFLWIAEGFVKATSGMTAMEVAQSYLNELIRRSLIQVAKTGLDRKLRNCRVHDLIYEIILSKCREHKILTLSLTSHTTCPEKVRRLRIDDSTRLKMSFPLLHLRSLFINRYRYDPLLIPINGIRKIKVLNLVGGSIPKKVFKLSNLTFLNLSYTNVTNIPKIIGKLQNLEYLNLSHTPITNIPAESIGKLQNLEYFNIEYSGVQDLPADIINLNKLCCLYVPHWIAPNLLGGLYSLQYLRRIEVDTKEAIREIGKVTRLRELDILCRGNGRELCSSLKKMTNLQRLYIDFEKNESVDLNYSFFSPLKCLYYLEIKGPLVKIPYWVTSCHSLSTVKLQGIHCGLREDPLEYFADLPNLVDLSLLQYAYVGNTLHFKSGNFQKLKRLELCGLTALELVILEEGTLPDLEIFHLKVCMLVEEMSGIQYLMKLRSLQLFHMSSRLQNKLRYKKCNGNLDNMEIVIESFVNGEWEYESL